MPSSSATPSLHSRIGQWIRALGIRCMILLTALMLTVPTAEVISASNAFAQTRDTSLASVEQAITAALPSMTPARAALAAPTPPDPSGETPAPVPAPVPSPAPDPAPTAVPITAPAGSLADSVPPAPTSASVSPAPAAAVSAVPDDAVVAQEAPSAPAPTATAPTTAAPSADPGTTDPAEANPSTTFSVSSAVKSFLAGLNISLPDGPVTGTLNGSTLTVAVGTPALPITLPVGAHSLSFSSATLTIDEKARSLSLSGTATSDNGVTATLTVTIGNVTSTDLTGTGPAADLSATVTITGVPVLGTVVDLTGALSYSGGKPAVSVTGKLAADAVAAADALTIKSGSTITLSSTDGFRIDGSALVGSGAAAFTVGVKGEVHDPKTWSLDVSVATDQSFSPIDGLTITPNFAGTITDTAGVVRYDLSSTEAGSWTTGPVTMALQHVEVSNTKPAAGQACSAIADGDVWFDVRGNLTDDALHLDANADACVNVSNKTFTITASAPNGFLPGAAGFSIDNGRIIVARDAGGTVAVSATGTLNITAGLPAGTAPKPIAITISFASDGSFVATGSVNLADLKLGTGTAAVYVASQDVKNYAIGTNGDTINLAQGVTLLLDAQPSSDVARVFSYLKLPAPKTIRTVVTLSPSGFTGTVAATFGPRTSGAQLLGKSTPGGATLNLNSVSLGVNLSATNASISLSGSAYMTLPPLYPGSTSGSGVQVSLTGSLSLTPDSVGVSLGFVLDSPGGWKDAFGIPEMTVQQVAGTFGIKIGADTGGLPVPTLSFLVKDLQLPPALASALGVTANTNISLSLAMDVDQPIVHFSIVGPNNGSDVALRPLSFAKNYPSISSAQNSIEIKKAEFLLAPLGGKDAAGTMVKQGATLIFDGNFGGVPAHIYASIGLATPQFTADASVGSFAVGPVTFDTGNLHISVDPGKPEASFMLAGGFTDKATNIRFSGKIELGASTQLANAAIALHIVSGQPSYLIAQADLTGQVYFSPTAGLSFGAAGSVRLYAANTVDLGNVSFSYSTSAGALWQQLSQAPNVVANTFRQIYGWTDVKIAQELKSLRFSANDVAKGIGQGLNETNAQVTTAMYRAGYTADQTVQAVKAWGNATIGDIATGLNQAGATTDQIVAAAKNAFGNSAATAYNTLQSIGQGGQGALASVANFFNPGTYFISNQEHWYDVPMFFDVYYASQAPDTHVIQWTLNGGYNQQWYVLPTDSGYAEIVNRNSGQCLSVYGNNAGPAPLVQYPCFGGANQQWSFSGGTSNLGGVTGTLKSRSTGLMADVAGESATAGAWIDQWYANGHNNQLFTFVKAIG